MKTNRIAAILIIMLFVIACNDQQDHSGGDVMASEKPNLKSINKSAKNQINTCEYIVTEILTTSPRFRQITKGHYSKTTIKNEGLSYGILMEGSPDKKQTMTGGFSRNYDFSVYKISPVGKLNTGYFSFNPKNKQLYEYDKGKNRLNAIEFDRELLVKYDLLIGTD